MRTPPSTRCSGRWQSRADANRGKANGPTCGSGGDTGWVPRTAHPAFPQAGCAVCRSRGPSIRRGLPSNSRWIRRWFTCPPRGTIGRLSVARCPSGWARSRLSGGLSGRDARPGLSRSGTAPGAVERLRLHQGPVSLSTGGAAAGKTTPAARASSRSETALPAIPQPGWERGSLISRSRGPSIRREIPSRSRWTRTIFAWSGVCCHRAFVPDGPAGRMGHSDRPDSCQSARVPNVRDGYAVLASESYGDSLCPGLAPRPTSLGIWVDKSPILAVPVVASLRCGQLQQPVTKLAGIVDAHVQRPDGPRGARISGAKRVTAATTTRSAGRCSRASWASTSPCPESRCWATAPLAARPAPERQTVPPPGQRRSFDKRAAGHRALRELSR
jgi:hypothetical protein